MNDISQVIELRQYRLHPGRRDDLIALFDEHFVDGQEACGMRVLGQFRDADDPDRFVWLRGFRDVTTRAPALTRFYDGPVWQQWRAAANATMIDSDDVLLLRPVDGQAGLAPQQAALVVAQVYLLKSADTAEFARFFEERVRPIVTATGAPPIARLESETAANDFPRLPVRGDVRAFVWLAAFADAGDYQRHRAALAQSTAWREVVEPELMARLTAAPDVRRLLPTTRSALGRGPATASAHDFDFLVGHWEVVNRRLAQRGVGCREWREFTGVSDVRSVLEGIGSLEELRAPTQGWTGMTLRLFDVERRVWSIYWMSSALGRLMPPVSGGFDGNRGTFAGDDDDDGRPVRVVFTWTRRGPDAAEWEQAFSYDGGRSWETNWTMAFTRRR